MENARKLVFGAVFVVLLAFSGEVQASCSDEDFYSDRYCDCGCYSYDPGCRLGYTVLGCSSGQVCVYGSPSECADVCEGWTCDTTKYGTNDGCDCNCGCWDPDCAYDTTTVNGCESGQVCQAAGLCTTLCTGWSCSHLIYGMQDGCHCTCGCWDPDCDDLSQETVGCDAQNLCTHPSECRWTGPDWTCPGDDYDSYSNGGDGNCSCGCGAWDPDCDNPVATITGCAEGATCQRPDGTCSDVRPEPCDGWYCDESAYAADDGCHCNCGCWDPDCDDPRQSVVNCGGGQYCEQPGVCSGGGTEAPEGWTCSDAYYQDGENCDCACGAWDPDCADLTNEVYNCLEGQICVAPGVCDAGCVPDCSTVACGPDPVCGEMCGECPDGERCNVEGQCEIDCDPECGARICGPDPVCGMSCGSCGLGEHCDVDGACVPDCVSDCTDRVCGDDGCRGSCGDCPEGEACNPLGQCGEPCEPQCDGRDCGDDGCDGVCGTCEEGFVCESGRCVDEGACVPNCASRECGDDGCEGSCGTCEDGYVCNNEGRCVEEGTCVPDCVGRDCGADGCDGSCGVCEEGFVCNASGLCVDESTCVPVCEGRDCGDDGCAGSCGACASGFVCEGGSCVEGTACVPDCDGRQCGDDGCGGSCGACAFGEECGYGGVCTAWQPTDGDEGGSGGCNASDGSNSALFLVLFLLLALLPRRWYSLLR